MKKVTLELREEDRGEKEKGNNCPKGRTTDKNSDDGATNMIETCDIKVENEDIAEKDQGQESNDDRALEIDEEAEQGNDESPLDLRISGEKGQAEKRISTMFDGLPNSFELGRKKEIIPSRKTE